jgi:hypothetical protein
MSGEIFTVKYIEFDEIGKIIALSSALNICVPNSENILIANASLETDYVKNGQVIQRPVLDAPESVTIKIGEEYTFENLPNNCNVIVEGVTHQIEGDSLTIEAETVEEYDLFFTAWPYMEKTVKVTINEA